MSMGQEYLDDQLCRMAYVEAMYEEAIENKEWITADKRHIKISGMSDSHIKNTLLWMKRNKFYYTVEYTDIFHAELNRRAGGEGI